MAATMYRTSRKVPHILSSEGPDSRLMARCDGPEREQDAATILCALNSFDALLAALIVARKTIKVWHGMDGTEAWDLYLQSPEMTQIDAAIAQAEKGGA